MRSSEGGNEGQEISAMINILFLLFIKIYFKKDAILFLCRNYNNYNHYNHWNQLEQPLCEQPCMAHRK